MKAHWIVENFTDSDDYRELVAAVRRSGRECFVIGRHNHFDFDPSGFSEHECVIVQGSIQMTKNIRSRLPHGCFPVAYNSWNNYLCSAWYPKFQDLLFNDKHEFMTLGELKANKFDIYRRFGKEALIFVRPDSGEKSFSGQLIDLQDFDRIWNNAVASNAKDEDLVIVSTPKTINGEWRFVCSKYDNEIIAQSTYQYQGKKTLIPSAPAGAAELCKKIWNRDCHPDSVYCVDICEDADGNFWLLEFTSFSSAGLYETNKDRVVQKVSEIAEKEHASRRRIRCPDCCEGIKEVRTHCCAWITAKCSRCNGSGWAWQD